MQTIRYIFSDGATSETEVSDEFAEQYAELEHKDKLIERKETRRHQSLDKSMEHGFDIPDLRVDIQAEVERRELSEHVQNALHILTDKQRAVFLRYVKGLYGIRDGKGVCERTQNAEQLFYELAVRGGQMNTYPINNIYNVDCIAAMRSFMPDNTVDFTLTDIPYGTVNRKSNGLRNLDKGNADILTFDLDVFLKEIYRVTRNSLCIFCSKEQFGTIYRYFAGQKGTVRSIVWQKSNPSPMNGQYVYLSGIELGVWFKKSGGKVFNAHCKNTVFKYPNGTSKLHPTEKNHDLLKELITDNTNTGDIVFDPCAGSGAHLLTARENGRNYLGFEIVETYYGTAKTLLEKSGLQGGNLCHTANAKSTRTAVISLPYRIRPTLAGDEKSRPKKKSL